MKQLSLQPYEIDASKGRLKMLMNMSGRETPVKLDSLYVKRV